VHSGSSGKPRFLPVDLDLNFLKKLPMEPIVLSVGRGRRPAWAALGFLVQAGPGYTVAEAEAEAKGGARTLTIRLPWPFCTEAWPRLALSQRGGFLL
ncbi:hypothetical protein E2I00_001373, partial [Balaenoptera physalus]